MRGKLRQQLHVPELFRIIPAHAGQTVSIVPRSFASRFAGSSPRMRGKPVRSRRLRARRRIIPAHAGQTNSVPAKRSSHADHPRACGANVMVPSACMLMVGSSPRMRGKPRLERDDSRTRRIIPAHAGQTWVWIRFFQTTTDHPRACGANEQDADSDPDRIGSSPRMRGKRRRQDAHASLLRIIPAHAGQTSLLMMLMLPPPDHPRACGANICSMLSVSVAAGSSPRMRGKRV